MILKHLLMCTMISHFSLLLQVLGLCGNDDSVKDNDFMGRNKAAMQPQTFIRFFSCQNAALVELNPSNHVSIIFIITMHAVSRYSRFPPNLFDKGFPTHKENRLEKEAGNS